MLVPYRYALAVGITHTKVAKRFSDDEGCPCSKNFFSTSSSSFSPASLQWLRLPLYKLEALPVSLLLTRGLL
jgi:hypothetical protein